jgi:hypothetical protein
MDPFSIPDRLGPVAPTEPPRRQGFSSDQRRRRNPNPLPPKDSEDDPPQDDPAQDDEDLHNVDELA